MWLTETVVFVGLMPGVEGRKRTFARKQGCLVPWFAFQEHHVEISELVLSGEMKVLGLGPESMGLGVLVWEMPSPPTQGHRGSGWKVTVSGATGTWV